MEPIAGGEEEEESLFPEIDTASTPFQLGTQHFLNCKRGEILLTLEELRILNDFLAKQENGRRRWRFASQTSVPQVPKQRQTRSSNVGEPKQRKISVNKVEDAGSSLGTAESKIKTEWARSLHRLLLTLMQQEVAKPFLGGLIHKSQPLVSAATNPLRRGNNEPGHLTRHSTEALRQKEIATHIQPYLEPTSLRNIISKLEAGQYATSLEVFNEIYGFFLSGYRHYQPASPHWIRIHQLATTFFASASSYPLKDDFRAPPSFIREEPPKLPTAPKQTRAAPAANKKKKKASESKARKRAAVAEGGEPPVRNRERRSFQKMLAALPVASHLELYEKFKTSATWKEAQEGRVELDDSQTPPAVFREMMLFCASRVTRKRPLAIHDESAKVAETDPKKRRGSLTDVSPGPPAMSNPTEPAPYTWTSSDSEESSSSSSSTSEEEEEDTEGSAERTSAAGS